MNTMIFAIIVIVMLVTAASAATNGFATWFTLQSSRSEGTKRENSIGTIMGRIKDVVRVAIMATVGRLNSG